jgi:hypothetical protein
MNFPCNFKDLGRGTGLEMHRWSVAKLLLAAALIALPAVAHADSFVLIASNNRSLRPHLPDLQYADDDAIRYYQLWQAMLPEARIALLAEPDLNTARANPDFVRLGRTATRANLQIEVAAMAEAVRQASQAGRHTTFYFVFAGHGDVESGRGFVELADGRLGAEELETLVGKIGAGKSHLILDSCNSFFMVRPRKPGGRALAAGLGSEAARLTGSPGTGAFLSTSTEQTVYEWSEIQSGIFSYLVRSGLMGGADANADGRITYDELRGFVAVASGSVANPAVRPNVFSRGPNGNGNEVLLDLGQGGDRPRSLALPPGQRFILRDAEGFRLAELHTEAGFSPTVRLWGGNELSLESSAKAAGAGLRPDRKFYDLPDSGPVTLAALSPRPARARVRGSDRMFQALFERPWGPQAWTRQRRDEESAPPTVYGLSRADTNRLQLHLGLLAASERDDRIRNAYWQGLIAVPVGLSLFVTQDYAFSGTVSAVLGGLAIWNLLPSDIERLAERGKRSAASGADPGLWLPQLSQDVEAVAKSARRWRLGKAIAVGLVLASITWSEARSAIEDGYTLNEDSIFYPTAALMSLGAIALYLRESNTERQTRTLMADPLWQGVQVAAAPVPGGFRLALSGRF